MRKGEPASDNPQIEVAIQNAAILGLLVTAVKQIVNPATCLRR
jgi:hypothetical protein